MTRFNSYFARLPEHRFAVVVLSNTGMRPAGPLPDAGILAHRITEIYLGTSLQPEVPRKRFPVPAEVLNAYVGRYELKGPPALIEASGRYLAVRMEGGSLVADTEKGKLALVPLSETTFDAPGTMFELIFLGDKNGTATGIVLSALGLREFRARRLE